MLAQHQKPFHAINYPGHVNNYFFFPATSIVIYELAKYPIEVVNSFSGQVTKNWGTGQVNKTFFRDKSVITALPVKSIEMNSFPLVK